MKYLSILFLLLAEIALAQTGHRFEGRVIENDAYRTPLYGATIWFPDLETGTTTNLNGYFSVGGLPEGEHLVRISFVGYQPMETMIRIPADDEPVFALNIDPQELGELQVVARGRDSSQLEQAPLSTIEVTSLPLDNMPRLLGEPDLIRMVQNLPGVKTDSDFTGGFHVRGGRSDQNLILLDGVPVYNPWHLFGIFSAFNTEALDRVELTKGVFPARYGGRVSSLLDIDLQRGSERLGAGYLTISPLSASFSYGRPINQNTSYLVAFRRTYMDPVFWLINRSMSEEDEDQINTHDLGYYFYDLNLKLVHRFTSRTDLEAAWFRNNDQLRGDTKTIWKDLSGIEDYVDRQVVGWKNQTGSLKLNHRTTQVTSETQAFLSFYTSNFLDFFQSLGRYGWDDETPVDTQENLFEQRFLDAGLQQHLVFFAGEHNSIQLGGEWVFHDFRDQLHNADTRDMYPFPVDEVHDRLGQPPFDRLQNQFDGDSLRVRSNRLASYLSGSFYAGDFSFHPGIRYEYYSRGGYHSWMPRMNITWQSRSPLSISAGYGLFSQYIQIVGIDMARFPTDRWFWSDEQRRPVTSQMATLGVGYQFSEDTHLSVEGYYKTMKHLLSFDPESERDAIDELETLPIFTSSTTLSGEGDMYGVELFGQRFSGTLTGWIGYTLSWSWNRFDELNLGNRFPARTDKRHDVQLFVNWDFAENWALGGLFNYKSGQPVTFATGHYDVETDPLGIGEGGRSGEVILSRNNFRMPAYHRLDLNVTWKDRRLFRWRTELSLNVINVYNRLNPWTLNNRTRVFEQSDQTLEVNPSGRYTGQMPVLPMFSVRVALGGDAQ